MDRYINANMVFSKFARNYMELKKELPIRPSEMAVLNIITQRDGKYTPFMIADLLGVSKPMIAAHLRVLLKKEYIYKELSKDDKRSYFVLPTDKANKLTDTFNLKQNRYLLNIETELGKSDFEKIVYLLNKTLPMLEKMKEEQNNAK